MGKGNFRPLPSRHVDWPHSHLHVDTVPRMYEEYRAEAFQAFKKWVVERQVMANHLGVGADASDQEWREAGERFFAQINGFDDLLGSPYYGEAVIDSFTDDQGYQHLQGEADAYYQDAQEMHDRDRAEYLRLALEGLAGVTPAGKNDGAVGEGMGIGLVHYVGKYNFIAETGWEHMSYFSVLPHREYSDEYIFKHENNPDYVRVNALLERIQRIADHYKETIPPASFMLTEDRSSPHRYVSPTWERLCTVAEELIDRIENIEEEADVDRLMHNYTDPAGVLHTWTGREDAFGKQKVFAEMIGETPLEFIDRNAKADPALVESIISFYQEFGETPAEVRRAQSAEAMAMRIAVIEALDSAGDEISEPNGPWTSAKVDVSSYRLVAIYPLDNDQVKAVESSPAERQAAALWEQAEISSKLRSTTDATGTLSALAPLVMSERDFKANAERELGDKLATAPLYKSGGVNAWAALPVSLDQRKDFLAMAKRCVIEGTYLRASDLPPFLLRLDNSQDLQVLADSLGASPDASKEWTSAAVLAFDGEERVVYVSESSRPYLNEADYLPVLAAGVRSPFLDGAPSQELNQDRSAPSPTPN